MDKQMQIILGHITGLQLICKQLYVDRLKQEKNPLESAYATQQAVMEGMKKSLEVRRSGEKDKDAVFEHAAAFVNAFYEEIVQRFEKG